MSSSKTFFSLLHFKLLIIEVSVCPLCFCPLKRAVLTSHNQPKPFYDSMIRSNFLIIHTKSREANVAEYSLYILKVWLKDAASSGTVSQKYAHVSPCRVFGPAEIISIILSKTKAGVWLFWT